MTSSNVQSMIQVYNALFTACIILACLALAGAVFIFFKFDIPTNFAIRTGRTIKVLEKKGRRKEVTGETSGQRVDLDFATGDLVSAGLAAPKAVETTLLDSAGSAQAAANVSKIHFRVTEDTVVIHTAEII